MEASQDFFGPYGEAKALFDEDVLQCSETAMYAEYSAFFHQLLARCADHSCVCVCWDLLVFVGMMYDSPTGHGTVCCDCSRPY